MKLRKVSLKDRIRSIVEIAAKSSPVKCGIALFLAVVIFGGAAEAQSGGTYSITQSVIAGGGGGPASGGTYDVTGTAGQAVAGGSITGTPYSARSGFWLSEVPPSAALVSIAGRVVTFDGRAIRNAVVTLVDGGDHPRIARTGSLGYFQFDDVEAGQTYVLSVGSKLYSFSPQVIVLTDAIVDLEFVALP